MQGFTKTILSALQTWVNKRIKDNTPDWNQNNPEADGYIKNRPFYDNGFNREIVLKETTFTAEESYYWCSPFAFEPVIGETYIVTFDGKEYICTCYEDGGKCIGNVFIASEGTYGKDTGEPFFYYWQNGDDYNYGMCVRYQGDHTITIAIEKANIQKIDPKYLPEVEPIPEGALRPDYNIYDPSEPGYIKNRPCYYDGARLDTETSVVISSVGYGGYIGTEERFNHNFIVGQMYRIIGDIGVKYNSYAPVNWHLDFTAPAVDSGVYFDLGGIDFHKEFIIPQNTNLQVNLDGIANLSDEYESWSGRLQGDWTGKHGGSWPSINFTYIHLHAYIVKELDEVMIPDTILRIEDYKEDRTHYHDVTEDMNQFAFNSNPLDYFNGKYGTKTDYFPFTGYTTPETGSPIEGYDRKIIFDGVEYTCKVHSTYFGETAYVYGNESLRTGEASWDTGEPFCWIYAPYSNQCWVLTNDSGTTSHTMQSIADDLKQLDEKYIPSTIARTADVPSIEGLATEEYVDTKISDLVNAAPEALDTLKELSSALGDDPNFATTVLTQLGNKADVASLEGLATESYVDHQISTIGGRPILNDSVTGTNYMLYVENGKLTMQETDVLGGTAILKDVATGLSYELYVVNGELTMKEAE